jgi:hypothetical protein
LIRQFQSLEIIDREFSSDWKFWARSFPVVGNPGKCRPASSAASGASSRAVKIEDVM